MPQVHILYEGRTEDLDLEELIPIEDRPMLGIDDDHVLQSSELNGEQIRKALSNHYDKPVEEFQDLVIEHQKNGNLVVRPNATFGT